MQDERKTSHINVPMKALTTFLEEQEMVHADETGG